MSDFLAEGYVFWKLNLPPPRYVAGANLYVWPASTFWRNCGAIPISRNRKKQGREYLKAQNECTQGVLMRGESLLTYPEEGRNTETQMRKFKNSVFRQIIEVIEELRPDLDFYLSPIYINYSGPIFDAKNMETARALKAMSESTNGMASKFFKLRYFYRDFVTSFLDRTIQNENKGSCRIHFGEPFKVREFLKDKGSLRGPRESALIKRVRGNMEGIEQKYLEGSCVYEHRIKLDERHPTLARILNS